jgi:epsilon-lactone hydrolase
MARFQYTVLSRAQAGQEEEFIRWYTDQHLVDVTAMPGVVSAKLFRMDFQRVYDLDAPQWTLMTLYELECEDPELMINGLRDASGSAAMPATDALDKSGMIQAAGHLIAQIG